MAIYKVVTVFSMLIAILLVVGGFSVVDTATDRGTAAPGEVDVVVALAGVALVLLGGVVYVFSTRFRAEEMENAKDDAD
jgi:divalent metal cation (Fe/Co/Zn/Cd) transporter